MLQWKNPRFFSLLTLLALLAAWVGAGGGKQWGW